VLAGRAQYPGYVFIGFPPGFAPPWGRILEDFDGIIGAVGHDGEPMAIHEPTMTAMLAGTRRPINYINRPKSKRRNKGQNTAEIVSGPYQGRTVRVIEIENDDPSFTSCSRRQRDPLRKPPNQSTHSVQDDRLTPQVIRLPGRPGL
jgi:transcription antitermination factor NusG